jgi:hypothetical protein
MAPLTPWAWPKITFAWARAASRAGAIGVTAAAPTAEPPEEPPAEEPVPAESPVSAIESARARPPMEEMLKALKTSWEVGQPSNPSVRATWLAVRARFSKGSSSTWGSGVSWETTAPCKTAP